MTDQKNTILAIVLSALVLIAWQYFVGLPQMEKQKQEAQLKAQQQQQQVQTPAQPGRSRRRHAAGQGGVQPQLSGQGAAPTPGQQLSREAVLKASPRVLIETPRLARLDRAQGRADRRSRADAIPRDGRSEIAADRAAVAGRQPASVLRRVRLGRRRRRAGEGARQQHGLDAAGLERARRRQAGDADLGQRRRAGVPPHHLDRRQVSAHRRGPGHQQERAAGRALSLRR